MIIHPSLLPLLQRFFAQIRPLIGELLAQLATEFPQAVMVTPPPGPVPNPEPDEPLMNMGEVKKMLGISLTTVRRLRKSEKLRGIKVGGQWRFKPKDIRDMLEKSS